MITDSIPEAFVWTKIQADAGQIINNILRRKELERQSGGTFWWGIGESKTEKVRLLLARDPHPAILFSLMLSAPHRRDSNPDGVLLWEAYQTPRGKMPLAPHAIVISRAHERNGSPKQRYYAFVCENPAGLSHSGGGTVDMGKLRNFGDGGKPIGSSQISAVVERVARTGTGLSYPITTRATLVAPYAVQLTAPRESGYWERRDIQEMICRAPAVFCEELEEQFHLVGSEVQPTDFVQDRIDLLAVDPEGGSVIIEIKRDSHKLHLLQALSYAGMVRKWEPKRFIDQLVDFNRSKGQNFEQAKEELEELLEDGEIESINRKQRILLLAVAFDYEVLATAEWLTEIYGVDIRCYRVALAKHGNEEFLTCTRAFPPPEITDFAIRRRQQKEVGALPSTNWDEALQSIDNKAVVQFFREELAADRRNNPKYKRIQFFVGDRRRFIVYAKRRLARVWQHGRFENDIEFWKARLGERGDVAVMQGGRKLRFYLFDEDDFTKFKRAVTIELLNTEFHGAPEEEADEAEQAAE